MNRAEFISVLNGCLNCLPEQERREALEFYENYFEDGLENGKTEQELIRALGTPQNVAAKIIAESSLRNRAARPASAREEGDSTNVLKIVLITIGAVILGPPAAIVLFVLLIVAVAILCALIAVLVAVPLALLAAGVVMIVALFASGVSAVGWGILLVGLGLLAAALSVLLISLLVKGIAYLIGKFSGWVKRRKAAVK